MWFRTISNYDWSLYDVSILFKKIKSEDNLPLFLSTTSFTIIVIIPFTLLAIIKIVHKNSNSRYLRKQFGFINLEYKDSASFWEIVLYYYKLITVALSILLYENLYIKPLVLCILAGIYLYAIEKYKPYIIS